MKKIPYFCKLPKAHNPDELFKIEEQDEVLVSLEYTTEYFPEKVEEDVSEFC